LRFAISSHERVEFGAVDGCAASEAEQAEEEYHRPREERARGEEGEDAGDGVVDVDATVDVELHLIGDGNGCHCQDQTECHAEQPSFARGCLDLLALVCEGLHGGGLESRSYHGLEHS